MTSRDFARALRASQTPAEQRLWYFLRDRRLLNLKFKRQHPLGPYVADFLCMEYKLIVEADGGQHGTFGDVDRDIWLREHGYTVLRFWNNQIHKEIEGVLEAIRQAVLALGFADSNSNTAGSLPSPASGRGAGGEGRPIESPKIP
ncbi:MULTISPECIES: endonuclease domain-containing protein [unclassified Cupriavidus]|uniref:endonuclease domain-containing protein n=1 Tax=unclassified Cupriavidus TaxID=2640874 RepID=UPI001C005EF9|nr:MULTISPECIES: endonuclease domain-containing protein [unclassified Cupriavidus]MCA3191348.1 endonuclease domain-containing protein [Cupriavidus sp.]MCA3196622.1 endonuclease domain-containing protein [Cupriavidus sp.]MCA3203201.1 endonuclease domain-containing protein [Cupriavidus sp.]MCA3207540.1 endonuclease domain-containing protein [Cupriavidus sp.]QWE95216.1 endonuclease domain-containing protein [Cupriavidus sp. EM10]